MKRRRALVYETGRPCYLTTAVDMPERHLAYLHAEVPSGRLIPAMEAAAARARQVGVLVDLELDTSIGRLDAVRALTVLRLTQEGLTNVARHAGPATRVRLTARVEDETLLLEIVDDGGAPDAEPRGGDLDPAAEPRAGGQRRSRARVASSSDHDPAAEARGRSRADRDA
ncbi:sensor histidine kinase [Streptosporangium soli]|nr:hypothetical protein [Streptosporangium sp. KLBMP 9127]